MFFVFCLPTLSQVGVHAKNRVQFGVSSHLLHFMTSKIHHHDCKGHVTCKFFHCPAMISSVAKVMGACKVVTEKDHFISLLRNKMVLFSHNFAGAHNFCYA